MTASSYFVRLDEGAFSATDRTAGAWSTEEQHFSPMAGLLTHVVERFVAGRPDDELQIARITFEILGTIAIEEFEVDVAVVRAGRTIELLDVTCVARGRPVVRGRIWRLLRVDTMRVRGGLPDALPPPDSFPAADMTRTWPGGFIASLDFRRIEPPADGRARTWVRSPLALVAHEPTSDLARLVALVDTMNGVGPLIPPDDWFFPNVDLSVQLWRQPTGEWLGMDTSVGIGGAGIGVTNAVLHDVAGAIGRAQQTLTIRPR